MDLSCTLIYFQKHEMKRATKQLIIILLMILGVNNNKVVSIEH